MQATSTEPPRYWGTGGLAAEWYALSASTYG